MHIISFKLLPELTLFLEYFNSWQANYAQNLDRIQALEALVSIFGGGGINVAGGNSKIFKEMIVASGAKLHLNNPVIAIHQVTRQEKTYWAVSSDRGTTVYDGVVLASPYVFISPLKYLTTIVSVQYLRESTSCHPSCYLLDVACNSSSDKSRH